MRKRARLEILGLGTQALDLVAWNVRKQLACALGGSHENDEITEAFEQVLDKAPWLVARADHLVENAEQGRGVVCRDGINRAIKQFDVGEAEQVRRDLKLDTAFVRAGDQLVEYAQRVTGRAAACTHGERKYPILNSDALLSTNLLEVGKQHLRRDEAERIVVGARTNRADHLVGLGRREHKLDVLGRFLNELEQRVEAGRGDHVGLVDDEDLEAVADRSESCTFTQVTGIIHAAVARRVDLDDVEAARPVACEITT